MIDVPVLLRCNACSAVNRLPSARLREHPLCGKCKSTLSYPQNPVVVTDANFRREVLESPGFVLVFFWASWCAHCMGMFPIIRDFARQRAGIVKVATINTEKEQGLSRSFGVMSVPRLTLFKHGCLINELNGAVGSLKLDEWTDYQIRTAAKE